MYLYRPKGIHTSLYIFSYFIPCIYTSNTSFLPPFPYFTHFYSHNHIIAYELQWIYQTLTSQQHYFNYCRIVYPFFYCKHSSKHDPYVLIITGLPLSDISIVDGSDRQDLDIKTIAILRACHLGCCPWVFIIFLFKILMKINLKIILHLNGKQK